MTSQQQAVARLNGEVSAAYRQLDAAALERLFEDTFVFTNPLGELLDKRRELQKVAGGSLRYSSFENEEVEVRLFESTAIVVGLAIVAGTYEGRDMSGTYRYTRVFVLRDGQWRLAAAHGTRRGAV